ncbi:MAG: 1-acylglycerol-3-phosphate O-acyltransferase [Bacteroidetes bacterium]|nr:1-acylglycerol-3-phosphate O-acyltransferase [Bacteroidota bacterium]
MRSVLIWAAIVVLILTWLPLLAIRRIFDRDPGRYATGRLFRKLGVAISRVNPNWHITIRGADDVNDRNPYIVVSNHVSNADIPLISNLPWEMKWIAKKELFDTPIIGWMMTMAGDIPVARGQLRQRVSVFKKSRYYLSRNISVMFFPEGTRSRSGKMNRFNTGAFDLAIREGLPILPLVIDGTRDCLPKKSWVFSHRAEVRLEVLQPITTNGYKKSESKELTQHVRSVMLRKLAEMRNLPVEEVDAMASTARR